MLLDAPWGAGKSYYIKKFIVEFILTDGNRRLSGSALTEEILLIVHSLPSVEE